MVDLPLLPDRIVTSTAPQSSVSRADIMAGANQSAAAVGAVADATMDIATSQAKEQAAHELQQQKITRDADGNVSVVNPAGGSVIFGRAGAAYEGAIRAGSVAEHSNIISQEMADLHKEFPTDPASFDAAADAWKTKYLQQHGGGITGQMLKVEADQAQTQHANSITDTAAKIDLATKGSAIAANQASARMDVTAMVRGGAALDDPGLQTKIAQFEGATNDRAANPLFGYSKEQAQLDIENFHGEVTASKFLYETDKVYKSQDKGGGYAGAKEAAKDILTNPGYKLTDQQREQYFHKATAEIRTNEALRKQDLGMVRAAFSDLRMQSAAGLPVSSDQIEQNAKAARDAGDPGLSAAIYSAFIKKPLNDDFGKQPIATMNVQLSALQGMNSVRSDIAYFTSKGYAPEHAAAIVSHIVHESGADSSAIGDGGTSGGLAQFHNERLTALKQFAADRGKPWTDHTTQLDFIDRELQTTERPTLDKLRGTRTPEEAAAAFYDYERPAGWKPGDPTGTKDYQSRLSLARQLFDGKVGDQSLGPAGSAWLIANRKSTLDDAATTQWKTVVQDYNKEGTRPPIKIVNDVVNAARLTGNAALLDQIAHDSQRMDLAGDAGRTSIPSQDATITSMAIAGHAGELPVGLAQVQKDLQRVRDATVKGLDENPIAHIVGKFGPQLNFKDKPPLDFSSDDSLAQSLAVRGKIAQFGALKFEVPPLSALDASELQQVQAVLASPDPAVKVRIFRGISTLPEDVRSATLAKLGSKDPTAAVEVFAGSLLNQAPEVAASILTGLSATDERFVPSKGQNKVAYLAAKDTALPVAAFNLAARTSPTGAFAVLSQAMDATSLSAQAGDTSGVPNRERLKQAADDVTGGILYHNGAPIIAPRRGATQSEFDTLLGSYSDSDMRGVTTGNGAPITADYLRNSTRLHAVADGRYLVQINSVDANPLYAKGPDGKAWVLDMSNRRLGALTQP